MTEIDQAIDTLEESIYVQGNSKGCAVFTINEEMYAAFRTAIAALREKAARENPKPLTLDELREIRRGWVWIVDISEDMPYSGWAIVRESKIMYLWDSEHSHVGLATINLDEKYYRKLYRKEWYAYRSKPLEEHRRSVSHYDTDLKGGKGNA